MKPERWERIKELFGFALEREPAQRSTFLQQACGVDETLRAEVESLLAAHETTESLLPPSDPSRTSQPEPDTDRMAGRRIGPYQVIREIGTGGMAVVYLAVRADDQYRKRVAIKLVKKGVDLDEIPRRFRNERQTLAALDHPNIVKLLDGGSTEEGLPYLVMDYVEGMPITAYCDSRRLSITERLELFRIVCGAVHYAHQNLIIHRDLKPGNILVTGEGVPKLLDFGIAKLLNPEFSAQTLLVTQADRRLMTPEYASPEQVRGQPVTTATDVYSLGVLLYELLTGHRPHQLKNLTLQEIERVICEEEPEKPSTAVMRVAELFSPEETTRTGLTPELVSQTREGRPEKLRRRLRGDLDNVVLMALRREPQRRYASMEQFSQDIRRHLEGLPVTARAPTFAYRSSKFVRRHKRGVAMSVLLLFSLIAGIVATSREARVARVEQELAERRFRDVHQLADSFLFEFDDAIKTLPGSTPARQLVVRKAQQYLNALALESAGNRSLQRDLAQAYLKLGDVQGGPYSSNLGDLAGALESFRKAEAISDAMVRANPKDAEATRALGASYRRIGPVLAQMGQLKEAVENLHRAIVVYENIPGSGPQDQLDLAISYGSLGDIQGHGSFLNLGDKRAALESYGKALTISQRLAAADPNNRKARRSAAAELATIGDISAEIGDTQAALESERQALTAYQALSAVEPQNASARHDLSVVYDKLADVYWTIGQRKEALKLFREGLLITQPLSAADPKNAMLRFSLAVGYRSVGDLLWEMKDFPQSLENYRKAIGQIEEIAAGDPNNVERRSQLAGGLMDFAVVLAKAGEKAEARKAAARGLEIQRNLVQRQQVTPGELTQYARSLLYCEPSDLRNPQLAVGAARRSTEMTNFKDPEILDTLAQAYFAAGHFFLAVETEEKALALLVPGGQERKQYEANLRKFKKALHRP